MHRFSLGSAFFTLSFVAFACGGSADNTAAGKEDACKEQCEELRRCDPSIEVDDCALSCVESQLTSKAGQEAIANCLAGRDCGDETNADALACLDDEIKKIPTSPQGEAFCGRGLDAQAECNDSEVSAADRDQCTGWISLFSDESLADVNECFGKSCDAMGLCLLSEFAEIRAELAANPAGQGLVEQLDELMNGLVSPSE